MEANGWRRQRYRWKGHNYIGHRQRYQMEGAEGWTNGPSDRRAGGRTDGNMGGHADGDGRAGRTGGRVGGRADGRTDTHQGRVGASRDDWNDWMPGSMDDGGHNYIGHNYIGHNYIGATGYLGIWMMERGGARR